MSDRGMLSEILRRVAGRGDGRRSDSGSDDPSLVQLCHALLGERSEASGLSAARTILDRLDGLTSEQRLEFFTAIATEFGPDENRLAALIEAWQPGDARIARDIHFASEPRGQDLIRILNRVPGATARLVLLRAHLLALLPAHPDLRGLDRDFQHLFASWFNRGFLEIRRIDWSTSAEVLEKIIRYEAVHAISDWADLRLRVDRPDRRLFAYFHPAMPTEPLIFVEVALMATLPHSIDAILRPDPVPLEPEHTTTAVFYSISNCQMGLRGISFGNFLIKQVVLELQRDLPQLKTFITLSPLPGLRAWIETSAPEGMPLLTEAQRDLLRDLSDTDAPPRGMAAQIAARYLMLAKRGSRAFDPVAHFHLGNGAMLQAIYTDADKSPTGHRTSWGVMVSYLYQGPEVDARHRAYADIGTIAASEAVRHLAKAVKGERRVR